MRVAMGRIQIPACNTGRHSIAHGNRINPGSSFIENKLRHGVIPAPKEFEVNGA
ncbi:hypothetical protein ABZX51_004223 [Aspergillus tubingensis]